MQQKTNRGQMVLRNEILALIRPKPMAVADLARILQVSVHTAFKALKSARRDNLVFIESWYDRAALWRAGEGKDAPRLTCRGMIIDALERQPMTMKQLALTTGYHRSLVESEIASLRLFKVIHVADWVQQGAARAPRSMLFALGNAPDAKRPPVLSAAERAKVWRRNQRAAAGGVSLKTLMGI